MYHDNTLFFGHILWCYYVQNMSLPLYFLLFYKWSNFTSTERDVSLQIMLQGKTVHFLFKTFPFYFHPFLRLLLSSAHSSVVAVGRRPVKCRVPLLNASLSLNPACTPLIRKRRRGLRFPQNTNTRARITASEESRMST